MPKYVLSQMPRYPGTPAPSWPGTFFALACLACPQCSVSRISFLGGQAVQRRPTRFTSLRLAAAHKKFAGQTTPRTAPRACMSELHKLFMSRQARQGGEKDRQARIFNLHCTVPQTDRSISQSVNQLALQRSIQSAIHPCFLLARSLAHLIRQWQSHPYLAPGNGNGAGTKRHQWPSDLGQQKSLVLISAPGGRPFVFFGACPRRRSREERWSSHASTAWSKC